MTLVDGRVLRHRLRIVADRGYKLTFAMPDEWGPLDLAGHLELRDHVVLIIYRFKMTKLECVGTWA